MARVDSDERFRDALAGEPVVLTSEEAAEARRLLRKLLGEERTGGIAQHAQPSPSDHPVSDSARMNVARAIYQSRKRRAEYFGAALFSEPAWDMLLALYLYGQRYGHLSVSRLAEVVQVPLTTAIRWLDYLESARLVTRHNAPTDRRKVMIALSDHGRAALDDYLITLIEKDFVKV